ncbi:Fur family transcriptional regulator [Tengunoibacter tsumagoiensis]|nr:Fur family transcriptional regulator [Tengunoibacter tsumagoiensis]
MGKYLSLSDKSGHKMKANSADTDTRIREKGYRLTPQRALILRLLEDAEDHLTIDQLLELVHQHFPSINQSTVYRTIDLLTELGLVKESFIPGQPSTYEARTETTHHHLICKACGSVLHIDEPLQKELFLALQQHYHYMNIEMNITSTGYCQPCWQKNHSSQVLQEE